MRGKWRCYREKADDDGMRSRLQPAAAAAAAGFHSRCDSAVTIARGARCYDKTRRVLLQLRSRFVLADRGSEPARPVRRMHRMFFFFIRRPVHRMHIAARGENGIY